MDQETLIYILIVIGAFVILFGYAFWCIKDITDNY